jgi:peptide/nickel transport system substrate-binding protein
VALDYATPKDAIVHHVLHGYAQPAYGDIPPLSWAYNPNVPRHPFDLARARAILAADGFARGPDGYLWKDKQELALQLWYINGNPADEQTNELLAFYWRQIGVKVDVQHEDRSAIWGPGGPQFTRRMTGISTTTTNNDDPDDRFFWNSAEIPRCPTCAGGNWIAYFHPFSFQTQIDALTNAAVAALDRNKRKALYARIETLLAEQVPMIFLDWVPFLYVRPATLHGFTPNAFMYGLFWNIQQWRY